MLSDEEKKVSLVPHFIVIYLMKYKKILSQRCWDNVKQPANDQRTNASVFRFQQIIGQG